MYTINARQLKRANQGLTNLNPNSTKISKNTESGKKGQPGYRKGRFVKVFKPLYDWQIKRNIIRAKSKLN